MALKYDSFLSVLSDPSAFMEIGETRLMTIDEIMEDIANDDFEGFVGVKEIDRMIEQRYDPSETDEMGRTVLMRLINEFDDGYIHLITKFINTYDDDECNIEAVDNNNYNAFMVACSMPNRDGIAILLLDRFGKQCNLMGVECSALAWACHQGRFKICLRLSDDIPNLREFDFPILISAMLHQGEECYEFVERLVDILGDGCRPELVDDDVTALMVACRFNKPRSAMKLITTFKGKCNLTHRDAVGKSARDYAIENGMWDVLTLLGEN